MLDSNDTGTSEGTVILLSGLNNPNGIAWHNGSLYVAEINTITRYDNADAFVIANKVRHCQASFANHYSSRRSHGSDGSMTIAAMHVMPGSKA